MGLHVRKRPWLCLLSDCGYRSQDGAISYSADSSTVFGESYISFHGDISRGNAMHVGDACVAALLPHEGGRQHKPVCPDTEIEDDIKNSIALN
jgi:hypothetical protein